MSKKILLIADDEEMNRKIISRFLKQEYEVLEAVDGKQALDLMHERHVDMLLLDIIMPEMDGLEVLEAMKQETKLEQVGVLVATSTKEKTERTALSLGADDVVSKPYDPVVIKKRIENIILMKEMKDRKQKESNADSSIVIQRKMSVVLEKVESAAKKVNNYIDIIRANMGNEQLVDELLDDIKNEMSGIEEDSYE